MNLSSVILSQDFSRAGIVLTGGQKSDIVLNGISGHCAGLFIFVRRGSHNPPNEDVKTFEDLGNNALFQMADSSGTNILGARDLSSNDLRNTFQTFSPGVLTNSIPMYFIPFSDDVLQ